MSIVQELSNPDLEPVLRATCARIAPVWPLDRYVAVNPYFGMSELRFAEVVRTLETVAGARGTMPLSHYAAAYDAGRFTAQDVRDAAEALGEVSAERVFDALKAPTHREVSASVPTVAEVAGTDLARFVTQRVGAFCASYFDDGQAIWKRAPSSEGLYAAWREEAALDRTPDVMGLAGFRAKVAALPAEPAAAAAEALARLDVPAAGLERYTHRLLRRVGGWASHAARVVWEERLHHGREDDTLFELLAVLLSWEVALLEVQGLEGKWATRRADLVEPTAFDSELAIELVLQDAVDRATQRTLVERFAGGTQGPTERPKAQAIFCIDVRSEVFRRHLETVDPTIETLGFAGFFGFPMAVRPLGHERSIPQCPVLLAPAHEIPEKAGAATETARAHRGLRHEVEKAWKAFKMGAVSCFSFVGPVGLAYLPKLLTDGLGVTRPVPHPSSCGLSHDQAASLGPDVDVLSLDEKVALASGALGAMSLTDGFARVVLLVGHGSSTVNNAHASGLDCGACGGRTGEANARIAAAIFNEPAVREQLADKGIVVPEDTIFVAGQHDTTRDEIAIFDRDAIPSTHAEDLRDIERQLAAAGARARGERAPRLAATADTIEGRSRDWAQTRPEWGLAGCAAFIAAPRHRTAGHDFGGRSFLHSYAWQQDEGFGVLELIMTAPVVVASWINLQYYASSVDPEVFGAGDKTLHDVVGAFGVLEGYGGDLRVGLPLQSVHDGERLQHEPVRLQVVIEAPIEAMNAIIEKHEHVRHLVDHGYIHLLQMNDQGRIAYRYDSDLRWVAVTGEAQPPVLAEAAE
jgi:uncharacterized protein YbcC (UPF0753/DUF2309 family)